MRGKYIYVFLTAFPKNSTTSEQTTATKNAETLKCVTVTPNIRLAKKPPTSAPTMPNNIEPKSPPFSEEKSIAFAIIPTTNPNKIQERMFTNYHLLFSVHYISQVIR